MNKVDQDVSKLKKLIDPIPKQYKENLNKILSDYLSNILKQEMLKTLPSEDREILIHAITCISHICPPELEELKNTNEYKEVYDLLHKSKRRGKIDKRLIEIYNSNKEKAKKWLINKKEELEKIILNDQYENYCRVRENNPEKAKEILKKILHSKFKKCDKKIIEKYKLLCMDLKIYDHNPLFLRITPTILKLKFKDNDAFSYITFLIIKPEHQLLSYLSLDDQWDEFPLKWFITHQPMSLVKTLFYYYKKGEDVSSFFLYQYQKNQFDKLNELLQSPYLLPPISHILCSKVDIIKELIECFKNKFFSATICLCLPLIEGILWDFATYLQQLTKSIFLDNDYSKIKSKNGKIISNPTIGAMLNHTDLNNIFDDSFIKYFCNELYNERNPILHGRKMESFTEVNAAKKIATLEYVLITIEEYIKQYIQENLKKNVPKEVKARIIDALKINYYNNSLQRTG